MRRRRVGFWPFIALCFVCFVCLLFMEVVKMEEALVVDYCRFYDLVMFCIVAQDDRRLPRGEVKFEHNGFRIWSVSSPDGSGFDRWPDRANLYIRGMHKDGRVDNQVRTIRFKTEAEAGEWLASMVAAVRALNDSVRDRLLAVGGGEHVEAGRVGGLGAVVVGVGEGEEGA